MEKDIFCRQIVDVFFSSRFSNDPLVICTYYSFTLSHIVEENYSIDNSKISHSFPDEITIAPFSVQTFHWQSNVWTVLWIQTRVVVHNVDGSSVYIAESAPNRPWNTLHDLVFDQL